jgi:hypothetical protein
LLRDALADRLLDTWIEGPDGQPKCLLDREVESWRPAAFGAANIASIPDLEDPSFNPGPDMGGKPAFVEKPVFENWLDAQQRETTEPGSEQTSSVAETTPAPSTLVAEPAAVAGETEERTKRRGPPHQYDWDEGFQFMRRELGQRGDPLLPENAVAGWRSDADVVRAVVAHIALPGEKPDDPPREPDFRHARKRVDPELKKWREQQGRN